MGILALIAEFETEIRRERQMEGIAEAKADGRIGRRPALVTEAVRRLRVPNLKLPDHGNQLSLAPVIARLLMSAFGRWVQLIAATHSVNFSAGV
jgi:DNA invertase Pin-like site-specific DNA recombinase